MTHRKAKAACIVRRKFMVLSCIHFVSYHNPPSFSRGPTQTVERVQMLVTLREWTRNAASYSQTHGKNHQGLERYAMVLHLQVRRQVQNRSGSLATIEVTLNQNQKQMTACWVSAHLHDRQDSCSHPS